MTKNKQKSDAAALYDAAPPPGSQVPDAQIKPIEPHPVGTVPTEPTDKVDAGAVRDTLGSAAQNLPADPKSPAVADKLGGLSKTVTGRNPKSALVEAFKEVASVVGPDKAKAMLVNEYGTEDPADLKSSQLMDAIDSLYGAK